MHQFNLKLQVRFQTLRRVGLQLRVTESKNDTNLSIIQFKLMRGASSRRQEVVQVRGAAFMIYLMLVFFQHLHSAGLAKASEHVTFWAIVLSRTPFLAQPGLEPAASALWDQDTDLRATTRTMWAQFVTGIKPICL